MVSVETGTGRYALHIHVLCSADAALPKKLTVQGWGEFVRVPWKEPQRTISKQIEYLYKTGHKRAQTFDRSMPADDPQQSEAFREALADYRSAREWARTLGLNRLPARVFVLYVPRLTALQAAKAKAEIERHRPPLPDVRHLTAVEWQGVAHLFPLGAQTPGALEKLRIGINLILKARSGAGSLHQLWQAAKRQATRKNQPHFPERGTVYEYRKRFAGALDDVVHQVRQQRSRAANPHDRVLAALTSKKISGNMG